MEVIVSSDGSNDRTNETIAGIQDSCLVLRAFSGRSEKATCINRIVSEAKGDIFLFTDANSMFPPDLLVNVVRNFASPNVVLVTVRLHIETLKEEMKLLVSIPNLKHGKNIGKVSFSHVWAQMGLYSLYENPFIELLKNMILMISLSHSMSLSRVKGLLWIQRFFASRSF